MAGELSAHPVAALFPKMTDTEFAALTEDIRLHGVRVPILVRDGQILDGRHRYAACQELGIHCPRVEWDGGDAWIEAQSRNLVRRHLAKDQICAIRVLASSWFPELMGPIAAVKEDAKQRKAQARDQPRGTKALSGAHGPNRSADAIGELLGVSGTTVKRVNRLIRLAPELVPPVAAGELSVKRALREVELRVAAGAPKMTKAEISRPRRHLEPAVRRVQRALRTEWAKWPARDRAEFLDGLQNELAAFRDELTRHAGHRAAS